MGLPLAVGTVDPNLSLGPSQRHFLTSAARIRELAERLLARHFLDDPVFAARGVT
jgi:hypothetical protein